MFILKKGAPSWIGLHYHVNRECVISGQRVTDVIKFQASHFSIQMRSDSCQSRAVCEVIFSLKIIEYTLIISLKDNGKL